MIIQVVNTDEKFYKYMGKFFGSRTIEKQINDRIYDDDDKVWYLNIEEDRVVAFASVCRNLIKNVYATKDSYLVELLQYLKKEVKIRPSTVTNIYRETYEKAGYQIMTDEVYKNFVKIS